MKIDPQANAVLKQIERYGRAHAGMGNVSPETGRFLCLLAKAAGARSLLEVGTSNGYSGVCLALAARYSSGLLTTLEADPARAKMAQSNFERAGLAGHVRLVEADARDALGALEGPWDFVFLDCAREDYVAFFRLFYPKLLMRGLIVADNALSHARALAPYLRLVRNHPDLESTLVAIGKGEEVTLRLR